MRTYLRQILGPDRVAVGVPLVKGGPAHRQAMAATRRHMSAEEGTEYGSGRVGGSAEPGLIPRRPQPLTREGPCQDNRGS